MQQNMPAMTEPEEKEKGNKKIIVILVILFLVLFGVVFFNSQLSKITEIQLTGIQYVSSSEVAEKSDIKVGDSFFFQSLEKIESRILSIDAVHSVSVSRKFPGVIKIAIVEHDVTAFEIKSDGNIVALLSSGAEILTLNNQIQINDKPVLTGWTEENSQNQLNLLKQLALIPDVKLFDISEILPHPTVAFPDRILIYTRTRFEVITTISLLQEKIDEMNGVIETQSPGKITLLLADTYVPFDIDYEEIDEK